MKSSKFKLNDVAVRICVFFALFVLFSVINPQVASLSNIIALLNNMVFNGLLALAMMLCVITGNLNLSLCSSAMFAGYTTVKIYLFLGTEGSMFWMFPIAGFFGLLCGLVNALLIYKFELPGIVATIAAANIFSTIYFVRSGLSGIISTLDMPKEVIMLGEIKLFEASSGRITTWLNPSIIVLVLSVAAVWFLTQKTMVGRGIYALGGNKEAAKNLGHNIFLIYAVVFGVAGMLSGFAGIQFYATMKQAEPTTILNKEGLAIAAVILGGTQFNNGKGGSVAGTMIGVLIITLIRTSLTMLRVPSYAQIFFIGLLIILGISLPVINNTKRIR